jgi:predicted transcriptional regulator
MFMEDIEKEKLIIRLRGDRLTFQEIADILGISKQGVWNFLKRRHLIPINHGGISVLREQVRIRDDHTCQICLKVWQVGTRRFDVHHLLDSQEGKNGMIYKNNKDFSKMITLCHECHLNIGKIKHRMLQGRKN